jgi:hypothetical protein
MSPESAPQPQKTETFNAQEEILHNPESAEKALSYAEMEAEDYILDEVAAPGVDELYEQEAERLENELPHLGAVEKRSRADSFAKSHMQSKIAANVASRANNEVLKEINKINSGEESKLTLSEVSAIKVFGNVANFCLESQRFKELKSVRSPEARRESLDIKATLSEFNGDLRECIRQNPGLKIADLRKKLFATAKTALDVGSDNPNMYGEEDIAKTKKITGEINAAISGAVAEVLLENNMQKEKDTEIIDMDPDFLDDEELENITPGPGEVKFVLWPSTTQEDLKGVDTWLERRETVVDKKGQTHLRRQRIGIDAKASRGGTGNEDGEGYNVNSSGRINEHKKVKAFIPGVDEYADFGETPFNQIKPTFELQKQSKDTVNKLRNEVSRTATF